MPRFFGSVKCCHHFANWQRFLFGSEECDFGRDDGTRRKLMYVVKSLCCVDVCSGEERGDAGRRNFDTFVSFCLFF